MCATGRADSPGTGNIMLKRRLHSLFDSKKLGMSYGIMAFCFTLLLCSLY